MLIRVLYTNDRYDMVKDFQLDSLIDRGLVAKFQRTSGWVTVGVDPVRRSRTSKCPGQERRHVPTLAGKPVAA